MPSLLVPRGDRVGARVVVAGRQVWLGTFDDEAGALASIERAKSAPVPKRQPRRVAPPAREQVDALAAAMPERLRAFVLVAAWSGLRLSEVAALEARDVEFVDGVAVLRVRCGKGGKARRSVLLEAGALALAGLDEREGALFRNARGGRFNRKTVNKAWVKARAAAGLEQFVFHDLRKFHATYLLDAGASDLDVAIQLGHFDAQGRPDAELVRRVYGFPDHGAALARVASC